MGHNRVSHMVTREHKSRAGLAGSCSKDRHGIKSLMEAESQEQDHVFEPSVFPHI